MKEIEVPLRPLTVLVGPNDSGKTSLLDAVHARINNIRDPREDYWRNTDGPVVDLAEKGAQVADLSAAIFRLPSRGIPMESPGVAEQTQKGAPELQETGENVAAFVDYLLRKDRSGLDRFQTELRRLVPGLEEVRISTPSPASRSLSFSIEHGFEIAGQRISTGVRMLVFFVALAHHPNPPDIALIEEPENGVHPKRLKDIIDLLRGLSEGRFGGRAVQVMLTTHSPYLLDHVKLPQDQVIVFRREDDGRRTATAVDQERLKLFLDEFMLGELWFNQGEEGLLSASGR